MRKYDVECKTAGSSRGNRGSDSSVGLVLWQGDVPTETDGSEQAVAEKEPATGTIEQAAAPSGGDRADPNAPEVAAVPEAAQPEPATVAVDRNNSDADQTETLATAESGQSQADPEPADAVPPSETSPESQNTEPVTAVVEAEVPASPCDLRLAESQRRTVKGVIFGHNRFLNGSVRHRRRRYFV